MSSDATKGLEGIVAAKTYLSDVRGDVGELIYRGYDINELAGNIGYEETVYLLHYGKLPSQSELSALKTKLISYRQLPQGIIDLIQSLPKDTVPMNALRTGISALGCFDSSSEDKSPESLQEKALKIIAQIPIVTAYFHLHRQGKPLVQSRPDLNEAANFLYLINGGTEAEKDSVDTLDMCYVLHADHGMNASTFASRVTVATLSDIYSAVTSAIGTLKGPLHGGANEAVIRMLQEIGSLENVDAFIADCLENKKKVMGIGHRVYKVLDPRAVKLRKMVLKMGEKISDPKWIQMSDKIAEIMLHEKGLHANVDFYSASVYYSLDIPIDLFTPIFAIARTSGWTAHVLEQMADNRLIRPQSDYIGPEGLTVTPIDQR
ncbi:MAG TPA: citrate synthase [Verrucomicrobiales bacterium]|nr:citrate synthase [Pedosphaera sp.]HAR00740.1 citrate synthase [Verrucomicrobiales bacterium]HAW02147.1 citrate synthase [Verrucomicrobiales bacterium]HCP38272.1 citrate synthase [Verrucomicrobiales bacterium]|tara:strand:- start:285 stop:1412 length:1128 start_codon:yes stop_codon:yes gene_type:complete